MPIIGVVNSKGGVGKTTTVMHLAAAASGKGHQVTVVDADHQGSATQWAARAGKSVPDSVQFAIANKHTLKVLANSADRWTVVDTGPGDPAVIDQVVNKADFIVIPTAPSLADIDRTWETLRTIPRSKIAAVLLTQVNPQTILFRDTRESFEEEGILTFSTSIPRREYFRQIPGQWPSDRFDYQGYGDIFDDIREGLSYEQL